MACYQIPHQQLHAFWRTSYCCRRISVNQKLRSLGDSRRTYSSHVLFGKGSCKVLPSLSSGFCNVLQPIHSRGVCTAAQNATLSQSTPFDSTLCEDGSTAINPSNGRVMLIDGTSIMYRAYYKLIAKLHHGHLSHADGNGDWVLTIFSALSLIIDVLEFIPSHVAVVFDHDGSPYGRASLSSKQGFVGKGMNFRHTLYPSYKSNRPPTPDTVVQGLQYLKASIKAMSIKVIEVPGVEADDVIGTLAVRSVDAGFKDVLFWNGRLCEEVWDTEAISVC